MKRQALALLCAGLAAVFLASGLAGYYLPAGLEGFISTPVAERKENPAAANRAEPVVASADTVAAREKPEQRKLPRNPAEVSPAPVPQHAPELVADKTYLVNLAATVLHEIAPLGGAFQNHGAAPAPLPFTSSPSSFNIARLGNGNGPTLLVIGGIQGDEPGAFSAAALLSTQYTVTSGTVWVVPDLNFASILQRSRGLFGDMNRKFAHLDEDDPEYAIVERIKALLLDDRVDLVLNLHDGSGFYRPTDEGPLHNPRRWGQSVIIDQETMNGPRFNALYALAFTAAEDANKALLRPEHRYHIHNTQTGLGDKEMEKSLSWFAVRNGKPAFGIEASKEFSAEYRAYYHTLIIESFMRQMGITFERAFESSPAGVLAALNADLLLTAYDSRLLLPLDDARPTLANLPCKKDGPLEVRSSKPLLALVQDKSDWRVAYGNRTLARVTPAFVDFDDSLKSVELLLDGKPCTVSVGKMVQARDSVLVKDMKGFRVNAIGARKEANGTESEVLLMKDDFQPRYSMDKSATTFRVEIYKDKAFAGMILVRFGDAPPASAVPLTATGGPESDLGF